MADNKNGLLFRNLTKSFGEAKRTIAESLNEDFELLYNRKIVDLCKSIRQYDRDRENMMNQLMSTKAGEIVSGADVNIDEFIGKDLQIGINRRNRLLELEIMVERYELLFGAFPDPVTVKKALPTWNSNPDTENID